MQELRVVPIRGEVRAVLQARAHHPPPLPQVAVHGGQLTGLSKPNSRLLLLLLLLLLHAIGLLLLLLLLLHAMLLLLLSLVHCTAAHPDLLQGHTSAANCRGA